MTYTYLGDRHTDPELKGKTCIAVRRPDGKCIRGRNANMLVEFPELGKQHIVNARMLRKTKYQPMITTSSKIETARMYAIEMHASTNHTYDGKPYEVHLKLAYDYGCKFAHLLPDDSTRETVLAAIWAHDVIEDCRQTYNDVKAVLGEEVAELVYAVTNEKGRTRKERANDHYYIGIRRTPFATFVKCCDRLANMHYSLANDTGMLKMYAKENAAFSERLFEPVYSELFEAIRQLAYEADASTSTDKG